MTTRQARIRLLLLLAGGALAVAGATAIGWSETLQSVLVGPAPPVRILLGVASLLLGVVLVGRSAARLGGSREPADLVRGVRMVFLAVAALAAALGWFVGSPLPIVAALVIAGIDVVETSILLLVTAVRAEPR